MYALYITAIPSVWHTMTRRLYAVDIYCILFIQSVRITTSNTTISNTHWLRTWYALYINGRIIVILSIRHTMIYYDIASVRGLYSLYTVCLVKLYNGPVVNKLYHECRGLRSSIWQSTGLWVQWLRVRFPSLTLSITSTFTHPTTLAQF